MKITSAIKKAFICYMDDGNITIKSMCKVLDDMSIDHDYERRGNGHATQKCGRTGKRPDTLTITYNGVDYTNRKDGLSATDLLNDIFQKINNIIDDDTRKNLLIMYHKHYIAVHNKALEELTK